MSDFAPSLDADFAAKHDPKSPTHRDITDILCACGWSETGTRGHTGDRKRRFLLRFGNDALAFLNDATDPQAVLDWFWERMPLIEKETDP